MPFPVTYIGMLCGVADSNSSAEGTHREGSRGVPGITAHEHLIYAPLGEQGRQPAAQGIPGLSSVSVGRSPVPEEERSETILRRRAPVRRPKGAGPLPPASAVRVGRLGVAGAVGFREAGARTGHAKRPEAGPSSPTEPVAAAASGGVPAVEQRELISAHKKSPVKGLGG